MITLAPNIEALVGKWLREHPDISDLGAHVGGEIPSSRLGPWVRVTLLGAPTDPVSGLPYFVESFLQLDCFAGKRATDDREGQMEAWRVKATARAVLEAMQGSIADGVAITQVRVDDDSRVPDTSTEPATQRYILQIAVRTHPVSS